jgi:hypothetical protein
VSDARADVMGLSDYVYHRTRRRLAGLTDDEYFWEPVPGCWTIRRTGSGAYRADCTDRPVAVLRPAATVTRRRWPGRGRCPWGRRGRPRPGRRGRRRCRCCRACWPTTRGWRPARWWRGAASCRAGRAAWRRARRGRRASREQPALARSSAGRLGGGSPGAPPWARVADGPACCLEGGGVWGSLAAGGWVRARAGVVLYRGFACSPASGCGSGAWAGVMRRPGCRRGAGDAGAGRGGRRVPIRRGRPRCRAVAWWPVSSRGTRPGPGSRRRRA